MASVSLDVRLIATPSTAASIRLKFLSALLPVLSTALRNLFTLSTACLKASLPLLRRSSSCGVRNCPKLFLNLRSVLLNFALTSFAAFSAAATSSSNAFLPSADSLSEKSRPSFPPDSAMARAISASFSSKKLTPTSTPWPATI